MQGGGLRNISDIAIDDNAAVLENNHLKFNRGMHMDYNNYKKEKEGYDRQVEYPALSLVFNGLSVDVESQIGEC